MSEEIVNRVQKSGLVTIDLDDIELPKNILEIDIKCWLHEGLFLKEKEFRASVHSHDWSKYKNSYVYVHCSSDAIVPKWAYMLVSSQLENIVFILWGKQAQSIEDVIDASKHYIIASVHPSPLSAHRGFFGSKPFSKSNDYLRKNKNEEIDWKI